MRENSIHQSSWLFDEPITDKSEDKYQRAEFTQNLAYALLDSTDSHGLIIGIHGPWGSGKTSLKNLLINALKAHENTNEFHIIEFEPWMYSGSGQLVSLLFKQIAQTLSGKTNFLYRAFLRLLTASNPCSSILLELSNCLSPRASFTVELAASLFSNIGNYLDPDKHDMQMLSKQRRKLRKKLDSGKTKIIVFIDDLDRLTDNEIVEMLKAVKAVGDLPYVSYVLLYDRDTLTKSLDHTCHNKGAEYLEKIIQVPIGLPEPPKKAVQMMLASAIGSIDQPERDKSETLTGSDSSTSSPTDIYQACIVPFVNNIRDAIRLTNDFKIRYEVLKDDVEFWDLLGITSIEVFRPNLYRWIIEHKNLICSHNVPFMSTVQSSAETAIEHLSDILEDLLQDMDSRYGETGRQDSAAVKALFPFAKVSTLRSNGLKNVSLSYLNPNGADRHIFRPEHFDAYFRLSIEQDSLHENEYKQFLLYDPLNSIDIDKHHWDIFKNTLFASKAGRYLGFNDSYRAAKVVDFCLDLEEKFSNEDQGYMTLNVALSILNAGYNYENYKALLDTLTQQILDSGSPLSLVLCAYLAYKIKVEILSEARTKKSCEDIEYLSSSLPYISILNPAFRSAGWKNRANQLCNKLSNRLKQWESESSIKPLSGRAMSIYANCLPALFDKYDDLHKSFMVFSHIVDKEHFVIFTLNALVHKVHNNYSMNLRLIQELIKNDAYKATVAKLINDVSFKTKVYSIINIHSVAAYEVALENATSANPVPAYKVDKILKEWKKQQPKF